MTTTRRKSFRKEIKSKTKSGSGSRANNSRKMRKTQHAQGGKTSHTNTYGGKTSHMAAQGGKTSHMAAQGGKTSHMAAQGGKTNNMTAQGGKTSHTNTYGGKNADHSNADIVRVFLEMLNMVKLYHWKTRSYAQHKATDQLYENLNNNIDKIIEVLLGKEETRIRMNDKKIDLVDSSNTHDFKGHIYKYREFLADMNKRFDANRDSDILSIRDDILVDIDQFLYLMTFDK